MKTPLYEIHAALGANLTEYQGWEVPDRFTDASEEYEAVRRAIGISDIGYRATLRVSGPERTEFLHRILSNDIKKRLPGSGCHAVLLTAKGKIVSAMKVLVASESIFLETEPAMRQPLVEKLELYQLMQKVRIEDLTGSVAKILVQGPQSTEFLKQIFGRELTLDEELQHEERAVSAERKEQSAERKEPCAMPSAPCARPSTPSAEASLRIIRVSETNEVGYEIITPADEAVSLWERLFQVGAAFGPKPVGHQAFNVLRVEAGRPWGGVDIDEDCFPQEVRLEQALDWDKGCYTGYEPVARIKFRGHVNRQLMGLTMKGGTVPQPGDNVLKEDRPIGRITTAVHSPFLNVPIALGFVRREYCEPGAEVLIETGAGPVVAAVAELPFYE